MTRGLTLVTGVWSPGGLRRSVVRSGAVYTRLLEELLLFVETPIVVLVDPPLLPDVERAVEGALRRGQARGLPPAEVAIRERPLASLPFVRDLKKYERFQRPGRSATRKDSVDFSLMTWAKAELVREIAVSNLCDTTHIGWIDAGIMHVADAGSAASWDEIEKAACDSDRIRILQRMASSPDEVDDPDHWYAWNVARVAGGLITMPRAGAWRLAAAVLEEAERAASVERFALEEQLLAAAETRHPELFERYYGDYFGILTNVRFIRRDLETVLANLSHCRASGIPAAGADVARALLRSVTQERLRLEPGEAIVLLDDGIACLRDVGDLVAARNLASLAAGLRAASSTMRYALQMQRDRSASLAKAIRALDVDTTSTTAVLEHEDLDGFLSLL